MKATNIIWDVDCPDDLAELPEEIEIPVGLIDDDAICDYLSDVTGFCHEGYVLEGSHIINACCKKDAIKQIQKIVDECNKEIAILITSLEIHGLPVEDVAAVYQWMREEIDKYE